MHIYPQIITRKKKEKERELRLFFAPLTKHLNCLWVFIGYLYIIRLGKVSYTLGSIEEKDLGGSYKMLLT